MTTTPNRTEVEPTAGTPRSLRRTRLAPSPTGALHLGNARTFLATWLLARQNQWRVLLRIEDLDGPRVKRGADHESLDDLVWLGLKWDEGPIYQSPRAAKYRAAIDRLLREGWAYPCVCSRREAHLAASAPHAEDGSSVYPGTCRDRYTSPAQAKALSGREPAIRFRVPSAPLEFIDKFAGRQRFDAASELGDFVIAKADSTAAYQLAVVVDDADMGVTDVVRGDDLIDSTPRQRLLYRALGWERRIPSYTHLPLVIGTDGRRLAKRHGDTRLSHYRKLGVDPKRVVALLAKWLGIDDAGDAVTANELIGRFDLRRVSPKPIVFTNDDDAWLRGEKPRSVVKAVRAVKRA